MHADRWYYFRNTGLQNQDTLYTCEAPGEDGKVFYDPNTLSEDGTIALSSIQFTNNGAARSCFLDLPLPPPACNTRTASAPLPGTTAIAVRPQVLCSHEAPVSPRDRSARVVAYHSSSRDPQHPSKAGLQELQLWGAQATLALSHRGHARILKPHALLAILHAVRHTVQNKCLHTCTRW